MTAWLHHCAREGQGPREKGNQHIQQSYICFLKGSKETGTCAQEQKSQLKSHPEGGRARPFQKEGKLPSFRRKTLKALTGQSNLAEDSFPGNLGKDLKTKGLKDEKPHLD